MLADAVSGEGGGDGRGCLLEEGRVDGGNELVGEDGGEEVRECRARCEGEYTRED